MANCEKAGAWMQVTVPRAGGTVAFPCTLGTCQKPWYSGESYIIVGICWNMLDVPMITIIVTNHSWNMGKPLQNCIRWCPPVLSWLIIPLTIDIPPMNRSHWSYKPT